VNWEGDAGARRPENDKKIRTTIEILEKEKSMVEEIPDLELEYKTRRHT